MNFHKLGLKLSSSRSNKNKSNTNNSLYINSKQEDKINDSNDILYNKIKKDPNVLLDINIESPPCTMYGTTINSTGALLSGILNIIVLDDETNSSSNNNNDLVKINSVELKFVQRVKYARPFKNSSEPICSCKDCEVKELELVHWDILTPDKSETVSKGSYSYPFSQLLSGKLPQSAKLNNKTGISYELRAFLKYEKISDNSKSNNSKEREVVLVLPIQVTHAILKGNDKNSIRMFLPTSINASCTLPNVVYPKSTFPLEIRLEGISEGNKRWRMRSLNWKIEERVKMRQYACDDHKKDLKKLEKKEREILNAEKDMNVNQQRNKAGRSNISQRKNALNSSIVNNIIIDDNVDELFTLPISNLDSQTDNNPEDNQETSTENSQESDNNNNSNNSNNNDSNISRSIPANTSYNLYSNQIPGLSNLDPNSDFRGLVHPNDYQLRQELIRQQQSQRQWQIQQEKNKDCSLYTEEIKVLAQNTIKSGWKSDFNAPLNRKDDNSKHPDACGAIELITEIDCMGLNSGIFAIKKAASTQFPDDIKRYIQYVDKRNAKLTCDLEDPILGLYISHILVVEIVVAEEILQQYNGAPIVNGLKSVKSNASTASNASNGSNRNGNNSKTVTVPTGAARVLRMQFRLNFTERSGMGIPWDDEVPPFYEDIKYLSPPNYLNAVAKTLDYDNLLLKARQAQSEELDKIEHKEDEESSNSDVSSIHDSIEEDEHNHVFPVQSITGNVLGSVGMLLSPSNSSAQFDSRNNLSTVFNSTQ